MAGLLEYRRKRKQEELKRELKIKQARAALEPYFTGSKREKLPPLAGRMYKLLSEVYGIPISELTPDIRDKNLLGHLEAGNYYPFTHILEIGGNTLLKIVSSIFTVSTPTEILEH